MLMAEENSSFMVEGDEFGADGFGDGGLGAEDFSIDLDMLFGIINEGRNEDDSDPAKNDLEESGKRVSHDDAILGASNPGHDVVCSYTLHSSFNSEATDSRIGSLGGSTVNQDLALGHGGQWSPGNACSASLKDWISLVPGDGDCFTERANFSLPTCSTTTTLGQRDNGSVLRSEDKLEVINQKEESEVNFMNAGAEVNHQGVPQYSNFENIGTGFCKYEAFRQKRTGTMRVSEHNLCTPIQTTFMDADLCTQDISSKDSAICPSTDVMKDYPATQYDTGADHHFSASYNSHFFSTNEELMNNVKNEEGEFLTDSACSSTKMKLNDHRGSSGTSGPGFSINNYFDFEGFESNDFTNGFASSMGRSPFDASQCPVDEKAQFQRFDCARSYISGDDDVRDEKPEELTLRGFSMCHHDVIDEAAREQSCSDFKCVGEDSRSSFSGISCSLSGHNTQIFMDEKKSVFTGSKVYQPPDGGLTSFYGNGTPDGGLTSFYGNGNLIMNAPGQYMSSVQPFTPSINNQPISVASRVSKVSPESSHSNFSEKSVVEDDPDVCIIEDISHPAPSNQPPAVRNINHLAHSNQFPAARTTFVTSQRSTINGNYMGVGEKRSKARDERLLLRLLQDISQPKSEMIPPDGFLAVDLLRHQRIALSWMVQKETEGTHCSGGILADDQGLGKTISTISLILKERPPSYRDSHVKQDKTETLNLDEDDDTPVLNGMKKEADTIPAVSNKALKTKNPLVLAKGRPAAGTLIVCPTSVLRQWYDELRNKVTSKANLSVLVYHGSNRTKDPCELAKYDVVLTTYSIVSMEVPKQPRADEDDEERGKSEDDGLSVGLSSSKKRKYPPSSDKKRSNKKGSDSSVLEALAGPLAKVGWFRVVLDEAQSIKNHRTQVARACWGLRAKRRWCLSGTPIQNAIDDLYSYFRFLKYGPFDAYKLFCTNIKAPINKSPADGYRKLQTVLKTIMLRRTKGTLLDGEPIIKLPPKFVELKKVEFSLEERDFYSRLEADSRAQFEEYAAAGTVKQNYVNILLMLLRLRQACDHPFLVKGVDSRSLWTSSVEIAKKLPREEQEHLLRCLEASLALCGICNDPPEDAVVAKCGHVFCNQCISEHLTGDDHQCPSSNCKARLNVSSVFSKVTLNSCLQDQSCQDTSADCNGLKVVETKGSSPEGPVFNSSKIKAALDVLQSLCGPQDCLSGNGPTQNMSDGNASSGENSAATCTVEPLPGIPETRNSAAVESSNSRVKVVGQKAIVFSQWTRMLDLIEACLKSSSMQYRRLDGTMSVMARDKAVKDFNTLPEVTVMIMSLKAASLGLNMVAACHVILLDLWWNPTTEDQAIDRAHRIGQTRPVTVLRLTVKDTVEDRILALQQKKREMVASAFGEDESGGHQTRLTVEDLKYLFMM